MVIVFENAIVDKKYYLRAWSLELGFCSRWKCDAGIIATEMTEEVETFHIIRRITEQLHAALLVVFLPHYLCRRRAAEDDGDDSIIREHPTTLIHIVRGINAARVILLRVESCSLLRRMSSGFGATVIATCLMSSQMMPSSSFVLMPTSISSSASSIKWQPHDYRVGTNSHLSNKVISTSICNRSTLIKLTAVRPSASDNTSTKNEPNIDEMTLPQILQSLNRLNIRYPPDAARSELEELLLQYYKSTQSIPASQSTSKPPPPPSSTSSVQSNGPNIVDAIVLDDDKSVSDEEYYQRDQRERDAVHRRQSQQSHDRQRRRGRTTNRPNNRTYAANSSRYQSEYREKSNQHHRQRRRKNYDLYDNCNNPTTNRARRSHDNVIDLDTFDIPDEPNKRNEYYDNGAQIFLMGFLEAGKTAAQLALDSVGDAVNPFSEDEKRWYDEERGREVLDVNILDYSPDYGRRTQRRYSSSETGRRRRQRRNMRSGRSYDDRDIVASNMPPRRRRSIERQRTSKVGERQKKDYYPEPPASFSVARDINSSSASGSDSGDMASGQITEVEQHVPRRNGRTSQDSTKPIYGLYNGDISDAPTSNRLYNTTEQRQEPQKHPNHTHPKKLWKKRLRKKFDAALGLQSPSSPSSSESLYDSWKTQVDGVHDGRKEVLRNEMNRQKSPTAASSPNNRRSRMRAKLKTSQVSNTAKSYLDEPPFWRRDGGTIASVLFDSQQSSSPMSRGVESRSKRRYNNSLDTLEALLRSPLGRRNTVTSLVVFVTRSSLSWFGSLCRWAGVRGTIPQPIVVTTVFAMGISSRRGYRALSLGLTLLALRMVGEFIHGSLHGNEFWEDDYNKETHEWTRE